MEEEKLAANKTIHLYNKRFERLAKAQRRRQRMSLTRNVCIGCGHRVETE